jgi:hypothetical protein
MVASSVLTFPSQLRNRDARRVMKKRRSKPKNAEKRKTCELCIGHEARTSEKVDVSDEATRIEGDDFIFELPIWAFFLVVPTCVYGHRPCVYY